MSNTTVFINTMTLFEALAKLNMVRDRFIPDEFMLPLYTWSVRFSTASRNYSPRDGFRLELDFCLILGEKKRLNRFARYNISSNYLFVHLRLISDRDTRILPYKIFFSSLAATIA
jgi:hypothetical protein